MGREKPTTKVQLAFALPLRNEAGLEDLLQHIYNPADPLYGHYLTSQEFADRFGPNQDDYNALAEYARGLGLTVTGTHSNLGLLDVAGPAAAVESAFNLHLNHYQATDGREFYAPDNDPEVPASIASRIIGVIGLDNAAVWHMHNTSVSAADTSQISPDQIGTGPGSALAPNDILTAYNLKTIAANGSGQTMALFELDGYRPADVTGYENYFGLPAVPLQNVLVDGFSGRAGSGAIEVTLDIELQIALSPGASKIIVYEGPNSNTGVVDTYNKIATDNLAKQISTSWGLSEGQSSSIVLSSENNIFRQMAAQGQSIYAASGDSGAYDNGSSLSVDDPASQPYVSGVGGTQLFVNTSETYNHESSWNVNNKVSGGAGGGGVSSIWSIPAWQQGIASAASTIMRNVPDVSLNADQYTGYSIYFKGGWQIIGGTSCAAPIWAAFTARLNQQRVANGSATLGFANPSIYQLASSAKYGTDFNDIADGSTNLYYKAVAGYDNSTGWGSFNGANLLADLAPVAPPAAPTGLIAVAGNAIITLNWTRSSGATSYSVHRGTVAGGESVTPIAAGINATTYADTVTNGVRYFYKVSATNSAGTSSLSAEVSAMSVAQAVATKIGIFLSSGEWYLDKNGNGAWDGTPTDGYVPNFGHGVNGAVPVVTGGTGTTKIGIYVNGTWYLDLNGNGIWDGTPTDGLISFGGGVANAIPVTGDWTGTGTMKIGIFADGVWYLDLNGNGIWDGTPLDARYFFGSDVSNSIPVTGDWTGSGTTKIGIYANGVWYLDLNGNGVWDGTPTDGQYMFGGGIANAVPVTGDWTGSGTTKIGIFADGIWYLDSNGNGVWDGASTDAQYFFGGGLAGAVPLTGKW